jgi:hypothetical protein
MVFELKLVQYPIDHEHHCHDLSHIDRKQHQLQVDTWIRNIDQIESLYQKQVAIRHANKPAKM